MTTPPDILDTLAKRVENASSLEELRTALIAFQEEVESHHEDTDVEDALREYIDLDHLPTFGGEPPKNLDGVRSWDKDRLLVGAGGEFWYLEFVERKEQPTPENDKETKDLEALPDKVRSQAVKMREILRTIEFAPVQEVGLAIARLKEEIDMLITITNEAAPGP